MTYPLLKPEDLLAHTGWMRGLARTLVCEDGQADDVVQDAFVAVAERPRKTPATLTAWLRGVIRNLAFKHRRSAARRLRREVLVARPERDTASPADVLERVELHRKVVETVLALPEPYRRTVLLTYFEELSAAEIAEREDVPLATVRTRLQRGLARLRERLDRQQGGRECWLGAMLPLAGLDRSWVSAAGNASATAAGVEGTTGAAVGSQALAASQAATSFGINTLLTGTALMTQKTLFSIAGIGLLTLAVGLGVGRYAARIGPDEAKDQFGLVEAKRLSDTEARLAKATAEIDALKARQAKALGESDALAARARDLEAQLKAEKDRSAQADAAAPKAGKLPLAFGKFADLEGLAGADWPELAAALKNMNGLFVQLVADLEAGKPLDPGLQSKVKAENAKLVKLALGVMGQIPTSAAVNGEFSHPLVLSNLMSALLEDQSLPLSKAQNAKIAKLGDQFDEDFAHTRELYTKDTPQLEKLMDELEMKQDCIHKMRDALTPQQLDAACPQELRDRVQLDVCSPGVATVLQLQPKEYASAQEARSEFQASMSKVLGLEGGALGESFNASFDAWYAEMEPYLAAQSKSKGTLRLDRALAAGRAQVNLLKKLLAIPGLDDSVRTAILSNNAWEVPMVVEKKEK